MIEILHHDPSFIVINKPSGVLTISTFGVPSIQTLLREQLVTDHDPKPFVEPPHRLDRGTSGALLIARNRKALSILSQQFHHRQVQKSYLVAIQASSNTGSFELEEQGTLEDWIRKIPDVAQAEVTDETALGAKLAVLNYRTLYGDDRARILEIDMQTGRMHQIRLQFASRGFPILGDKAYGSNVVWEPSCIPKSDANVEEPSHAQYTALHALHLAFRHPKDATNLSIHAPVPLVWRDYFPSFDFTMLRTPIVKLT